MNIETSLCLIFFLWIEEVAIVIFLERLCSCYFPFLLSARFFYTIKHPKLRNLLISPQRTRSKSSETAPEDRNKLPLCGFVYCLVAFLWLSCELIITLSFLFLNVVGSDFVNSPFMAELASIGLSLYVNEYFWIFIAGMPVLYMVDYSLGLRRWQKRQSR